MAVILHPKKWNQQPPEGAQINFGHPLAKGLTFYILFDAGGGVQKALLPANLPGTTVGTVPAPNWKTAPGGLSQNWNGNWSTWYERGVWVEPSTQVTLAMSARRTGTIGSDSRICEKTFTNNVNPFLSYALDFNPSGAGQDTFQSAVTTGGTVHGGTNVVLSAGALLNKFTAAMTYDGAHQIAWFNGIQKQSDAVTGAISYDTSSTGRFIVSGVSSAAAAAEWVGEAYYVAVWNRALTASEMMWLHAEPYVFLSPKKTIRYNFAPAATRTYSYYITLERLF
jgi:hypothetical protein